MEFRPKSPVVATNQRLSEDGGNLRTDALIKSVEERRQERDSNGVFDVFPSRAPAELL